jgi:hypothetical protein
MGDQHRIGPPHLKRKWGRPPNCWSTPRFPIGSRGGLQQVLARIHTKYKGAFHACLIVGVKMTVNLPQKRNKLVKKLRQKDIAAATGQTSRRSPKPRQLRKAGQAVGNCQYMWNTREARNQPIQSREEK